MKDKNGNKIKATASCTNCAKQCDCQMLVDCESSYCSDYAGGETTYKQLFEQAAARIAALEAENATLKMNEYIVKAAIDEMVAAYGEDDFRGRMAKIKTAYEKGIFDER